MTTSRDRGNGLMRSFVVVAGAFVVAAVTTVGAAPQQTPAASHVRDAEAIIDAMVAGDFALIVSKFDDTMRAAVTENVLRTGWVNAVAQIGKYVRHAPAKEELRGAYVAVLLPCEFERGKLDLSIVFDAAGAIAGLSMRPPPAAYAIPPYATPAAYTEREVTVGVAPWTLPGTLTVPVGAGPFPAVVLVHGSGPADRDETIGPNKLLKDLALGLASQGVAVLRYEKRTQVYGAKLMTVTQFTVKDESVDDAVSAANLLRAEPSIDKARIFVLGHSLGGMLAPRIAAADPKLAGIIVMAGLVRPLDQTLVEQYEYLAAADGTVTDLERQRIDEAKKTVADVAALTPADAAAGKMIGNVPAAYWLDLRGYNPAVAAAKLSLRMLLLQGERDYQVTMTDFDKWKAALASRPNVTFHSYPALNHLFLPGTGKSVPTEYAVAGHVPEEVIRDIADWIKTEKK